MSRSTITIFFIGILLLIYGYLCRFLSIYFFWDSKHFGWIMIFTGIMGFFIDQKKARTAKKENVFFARCGIAIIILLFAAVGSAVLSLKTSATYANAVELIKIDGEIKNEVGDVKGFGWFLTGPEIMKTLYNSTGSSSFIVTVRGNKGHKDVKVSLHNGAPASWAVASIDPIHY